MAIISNYNKDVGQSGNKASKTLAEILSETLDVKYVRTVSTGKGGISVLSGLPDSHYLVVADGSGDHSIKDPVEHARSMIRGLWQRFMDSGFQPLAYSNVLDVAYNDAGLIERIAKGMRDSSLDLGVACLNGEEATLKRVINPDIYCNVSGTMVGLVEKKRYHSHHSADAVRINGIRFTFLEHNGLNIGLNADGVGTMVVPFAAAGKHEESLVCSAAMKADDVAKLGAKVIYMGDIIESRGRIPIDKFDRKAKEIGNEFGFRYNITDSPVGDRLLPFLSSLPSFNVSGNCVWSIDDKTLSNLPQPREGDTLVAFYSRDTPRSNGLTAKQDAMEVISREDCQEAGVIHWHNLPKYSKHLDYLSTPATIFYGLFSRLHDEGIASSFFHLSGGAYKDKLAVPLAKHGLFVKLENLFAENPIEIELAKVCKDRTEAVYEAWPMNTEALSSTSNPYKVMDTALEMGFQSRIVGKLEKLSGKTGVELVAYDGSTVRFDGK